MTIGGAGAFGSEGGDPPVLNNGTMATGQMMFAYDDVANTLTLIVSNDSPVVPGEPNPLITDIFFNVPYLACTAITLNSQVGSGGATPSFVLSVDPDLFSNPNPLGADGLGAYNVRLSTPGGGIAGAIANPLADTFGGPAGSWVEGPVTFEFSVTGPGVDTLTASSFANSLSQNPPGSTQVTGVFKFQGGGAGASGSAFIGNNPDCEPGGWMVGAPCIGSTVQFVLNTAPGCFGCMAASPDPGPTQVGPFLIPIGMPAFTVVAVFAPPVSVKVKPITIPADPLLVGATIYFTVVTLDPLDPVGLGIVDSFSITIQPPC
jgi:hypothetical protein